MGLQVGYGHATARDAARAGRAAASEAVETVDDPVVGVVFCSSEYAAEPLLGGVADTLPVPLVGTSTSGEIVDTGSYTESVVVLVLGGEAIRAGCGSAAYEPATRPAGRRAAGEALDALPGAPVTATVVDRVADGWQPLDAAAALMFVTHGRDNEAVVAGASDALGSTTITGGWAGDDWKDDGSNRVFHGRNRFDAGAAVAALDLDVRSGAGVAHGLASTTAEYMITDGDGSYLRELDGRPAYDVFHDHFGDRIETAQFLFTTPVGVEISPGTVRPLLPVDADAASGAITLDGPERVRSGRRVRLLEPTTEELLDGAAGAVDRALARAGDPDDVAAVLLHDCGCRWYHLSDTATRERELDVVAERVGPDVPVVGWYTAGELRHPDPLASYHKESLVAWVLTDERL